MRLNQLYLDGEKAQFLARNYPIYPAFGLLTCGVATVVAILLIPENPYPAGALALPASVLAIGLLLAPAYACANNAKAALRVENLLIISPIYWLLLDLLQGAYPMTDVSPGGIKGAFIAIGVFSGGVWLVAFTRPLRLPRIVVRAASHSVRAENLFWLALVFFGLGFFRFAYPARFNPSVMLSALLDSRWNAPWTRGAVGDWDSFLDHMAYFGYLMPVLTVLIAHHSKRLNLRVVISIILALVMTAFLAQGGGRRIVGVIWGAAIICWLVQQPRISATKLLISFVGVALILVFMQTMLEYRTVGFRALSDEQKRTEYDYLHVDDNFLRLGQVIERVPDYYPYTYEKQIVYYAVRPIPRVFWADKPLDPGVDLSNIFEKNGVSLSISAIGELYLSWGWIAVFLGGCLYGKLANTISTLLVGLKSSSSALVYSIATMALVAGMRSIVEVILMGYPLLAWLLITWLLVLKPSRTMTSPLSVERN